jgi:hypothetical protein
MRVFAPTAPLKLRQHGDGRVRGERLQSARPIGNVFLPLSGLTTQERVRLDVTGRRKGACVWRRDVILEQQGRLPAAGYTPSPIRVNGVVRSTSR